MEMFPACFGTSLSLKTKTDFTAIATTSCQNISQKDEKCVHENTPIKKQINLKFKHLNMAKCNFR